MLAVSAAATGKNLRMVSDSPRKDLVFVVALCLFDAIDRRVLEERSFVLQINPKQSSFETLWSESGFDTEHWKNVWSHHESTLRELLLYGTQAKFPLTAVGEYWGTIGRYIWSVHERFPTFLWASNEAEFSLAHMRVNLDERYQQVFTAHPGVAFSSPLRDPLPDRAAQNALDAHTKVCFTYGLEYSYHPKYAAESIARLHAHLIEFGNTTNEQWLAKWGSLLPDISLHFGPFIRSEASLPVTQLPAEFRLTPAQQEKHNRARWVDEHRDEFNVLMSMRGYWRDWRRLKAANKALRQGKTSILYHGEQKHPLDVRMSELPAKWGGYGPRDDDNYQGKPPRPVFFFVLVDFDPAGDSFCASSFCPCQVRLFRCDTGRSYCRVIVCDTHKHIACMSIQDVCAQARAALCERGVDLPAAHHCTKEPRVKA